MPSQKTELELSHLTRSEIVEYADTLKQEIKFLGLSVDAQRDANVFWLVIACISLALNIVAVIGMDKVPQ
ncbi:MAG: hypothetical protein ACRCUH_15260 [Shewanella sp.]